MRVHRVQKVHRVQRVVVSPLRAMSMKSALRDDLAVPYDIVSILVIGSLRSPPPYPASPDFSTGKRVTRFSGRFAPLRIVFPCHPCSGCRIKHREASLHKRLCRKHGLLCPRLRGKGGGAATKGGLHFLARRAVVWFSLPQAAAYKTPL